MIEESPSELFRSIDHYREQFEEGLRRLLQGDESLGVLILVLANASFDPMLWGHLRPPLRRRFLAAVERHAEEESGAAADDLEVFRRLHAYGFDRLETTEHRRIGPWEMQFNLLRSFRPPRMSDAVVTEISAPFNPAGFHFAKPFLRKEILWQGELAGRTASLFYNKFPFVELHGLLVPEMERGHPQLLTREMLAFLWEATRELGQTLPQAGFGYNSYGAYASVNHLHFQMYVREEPLPVASGRWSHNGGDEDYPTRCHRFDDPESAWQRIAQLHDERIGYNLISLPGTLYCLPRALQGSYRHSGWTGGFAWYEMAGGFTTFSRDQFLALGEEELREEYQRLGAKGRL